MEFLAVAPQSADAHCLIALIHAKEKLEYKAVAAAKAAISYAPDWAYTHYVHALVAYWFENYSYALRSLSEALRLDPGDPDYYELLSSIHYEQGHYQTSVDTAKQGLEHAPEHVGCLYRVGVALFDLRKRENAREYFTQVLRLEPEHSSAQGFIGYFDAEAGRYQEALPKLSAALREYPQWTFFQTQWKEALKGSYPAYKFAARLRSILHVQHPLLFRLVLFIPIGLWFGFALACSGGIDAFGIIVLTLMAGGVLTVVVSMLILWVIDFYLKIVSFLLLNSIKELRHDFDWKLLVRRHWMMVAMVILALVMIALGLFNTRKR